MTTNDDRLSRSEAASAAQAHLIMAVDFAEQADAAGPEIMLNVQLGNLHAQIGQGFALLAAAAWDA